MVNADHRVDSWPDMKPADWLLRQLQMSCCHYWLHHYHQVHIQLQVITPQYRDLKILDLYNSLLCHQKRHLNNGWERAYGAQTRSFTIAMPTMIHIWPAL